VGLHRKWGSFPNVFVDGALLALRTQEVFDRKGHAYPEGVAPDMQVKDPPVLPRLDVDPGIVAAENWLAKQLK